MSRNIYLVDDDAGIRASLYMMLAAQPDLIVRSFSNGDQFLSEFESLDPGVVLLDYRMPGSNGIDILQAVAASGTKRFSTVMLTGHGDVRIAVAAMIAGAVDFLEKPYEPQHLFACIDDAFTSLAREITQTERVAGARSRLAALSRREKDVLKMLIEGRPNKLIADAHGISPRTVEIYRANLMKKLGARTLAAAVRTAFAAGLVDRASA